MNKIISQQMNTKQWLMLLLLALLCGGSFFFVEVVISELAPLVIVFLRVGLASLALWGFILIRGIAIPKKVEVWKAFAVMGILNNVIPFTLIVWGQVHIASGLASILNATTPLFTVVVAGLLLTDERPSKLKLVGVGIGFLGAVIMIGPSALEGLGSNIIAQAAVLAAALSYAFAGVYGRRFKAMNLHPTVAAAVQVTASSILLIPLLYLTDQSMALSSVSMLAWIAVLGLAILSTAIAYTLYFHILASAGATNLLLVTFLIPVSAVILGTCVLRETLEYVHVIGMLFIMLGLTAIDGRLWSLRNRHNN